MEPVLYSLFYNSVFLSLSRLFSTSRGTQLFHSGMGTVPYYCGRWRISREGDFATSHRSSPRLDLVGSF